MTIYSDMLFAATAGKVFPLIRIFFPGYQCLKLCSKFSFTEHTESIGSPHVG